MSRPATTATRPARRASQRPTVSIDLAARGLRDLMIEQCRSDKWAYLTVYRGTFGDLIAAGVPAEAFPSSGRPKAFKVQTVNVCCTGSRELLKGAMRQIDAGFELEVDWGAVRPYMQGGHPAVNELARMLLKDIMAWTTTSPWSDLPDLAQPMNMVAADERAVDYKPLPGAPRLCVTPEFHKQLRELATQAFELVHSRCEVHVVDEPSCRAPDAPRTLRVVGGAA